MAVSNTAIHSEYAAPGRRDAPARPGFIARLREDRAALRRVLMIGGVVLVALVSLAFWLMGGRYVTTDDAYVQAAKLMVSTDVSGLVQDVDVREGQRVTKGQVLFRLDPKPFRIALSNTKAQLAQMGLTVKSMQEDYRRMLSDVDAQRAQVDLAQRNYARYAGLLKANAISSFWPCSKQRRLNWPSSGAARTCRWNRTRNSNRWKRRCGKRSVNSTTPWCAPHSMAL
jgi:hypothetical protein